MTDAADSTVTSEEAQGRRRSSLAAQTLSLVCRVRGHVPAWLPARVPNPWAHDSREFGCARCGVVLRSAPEPTVEVRGAAPLDRATGADEMRAALVLAADAVVWMSGASDFGPGGAGHDGWVVVRDEHLPIIHAALQAGAFTTPEGRTGPEAT